MGSHHLASLESTFDPVQISAAWSKNRQYSISGGEETALRIDICNEVIMKGNTESESDCSGSAGAADEEESHHPR